MVFFSPIFELNLFITCNERQQLNYLIGILQIVGITISSNCIAAQIVWPCPLVYTLFTP